MKKCTNYHIVQTITVFDYQLMLAIPHAVWKFVTDLKMLIQEAQQSYTAVGFFYDIV